MLDIPYFLSHENTSKDKDVIVETCSDELAIENDMPKRKIACLKWDNEKLKLEVDSLATGCKNLASGYEIQSKILSKLP